MKVIRQFLGWLRIGRGGKAPSEEAIAADDVAANLKNHYQTSRCQRAFWASPPYRLEDVLLMLRHEEGTSSSRLRFRQTPRYGHLKLAWYHIRAALGFHHRSYGQSLSKRLEAKQVESAKRFFRIRIRGGRLPEEIP